MPPDTGHLFLLMEQREASPVILSEPVAVDASDNSLALYFLEWEWEKSQDNGLDSWRDDTVLVLVS